MKSFETFSPQPKEQKEQLGLGQTNERDKSLMKRQEQMADKERNRIAERFKKVTGRARVLLNVFLLSTTIGCASARASEEKQIPKPGDENHITVRASAESITKPTNSLDVIHRDKQFTWGIEYVPKEKEGKGILAQRYVRINNETGGTETFGEFDNVFQAAEGVARISGLPEEIRERAQHDAGIIQNEAGLLEKGWLELPNGKHGVDVPGSEKIVDGKKVHTEVRRTYDNEGFDVIAVWEIDKEGNEVSYEITNRGDSEYDRYLKIIEAAKNKK